MPRALCVYVCVCALDLVAFRASKRSRRAPPSSSPCPCACSQYPRSRLQLLSDVLRYLCGGGGGGGGDGTDSPRKSTLATATVPETKRDTNPRRPSRAVYLARVTWRLHMASPVDHLATVERDAFWRRVTVWLSAGK